MTRILITSIGSFAAVSVALCLGPVRRHVRLIATNSQAEAAGNFLADRTILVPKTTDAERWIRTVAELVDEEQVDLVLSGRDEEVALLGTLRDRKQGNSTNWLVPTNKLASLLSDRYETAQLASAHGLPFSQTAKSPAEVEALLDRYGWPVLAKPRLGGTGGRGVVLLYSRGEVDNLLERGQHVFQRFLSSPQLEVDAAAWREQVGIPWHWSFQSLEHEIDLLVDGHGFACCLSAGTAVGAFNRDIHIVSDASMQLVAKAYGDVLGGLGYKGPVNLQGRLLPDGSYVPFEINPRFTGTAFGKAQVGHNMVLAALRHWCGIPEQQEQSAAHGLVANRIPIYSLTTDPRDVRQLSETGEWRRE